MATLVIGAGLVGSQIARVLAERGETPVLMDPASQPDAIAEVVALDRVTLIKGDILRPLDITPRHPRPRHHPASCTPRPTRC